MKKGICHYPISSTKKVWRFHYQLTVTDGPPDEGTLRVAKERLRMIADELTLESFEEEEINVT